MPSDLTAAYSRHVETEQEKQREIDSHRERELAKMLEIKYGKKGNEDEQDSN